MNMFPQKCATNNLRDECRSMDQFCNYRAAETIYHSRGGLAFDNSDLQTASRVARAALAIRKPLGHVRIR
jgi:hypothetical protein